MGADIHCYIEHRRGGSQNWYSFGGRINPGRNYAMFGKLAGVRGGVAIVEPRGVPDDFAYAAQEDYWLWITRNDEAGENEVTAADAAKYVAANGCEYVGTKGGDGKPNWVTHPDWHSSSWHNADEWDDPINATMKEDHPYRVASDYYAILAALREFEKQGDDSRVVFWFDN